MKHGKGPKPADAIDVYRIEGHDHIGPFVGDPLASMLIPYQYGPAWQAKVVAQVMHVTDPTSLPVPGKDGIPTRPSDDYLCGFSSLHQYGEWFVTPEVREALYVETDMKLHHYVISQSKVLMGGHQVMFNPKDAYSEDNVDKQVRIQLE